MDNLSKYREIFSGSFKIPVERLPGLKYQETPLWDSIGHMALVSAIEDAFDVMLETDDIIDFSSYEKGIEILKKYGVEF